MKREDKNVVLVTEHHYFIWECPYCNHNHKDTDTPVWFMRVWCKGCNREIFRHNFKSL